MGIYNPLYNEETGWTPMDQLTPQHLAELRNLSRQQLAQMAEKARALARPDATAAVAQVCAQLAGAEQ